MNDNTILNSTHLRPDCSYAWGINDVSLVLTLQVCLGSVISLVLTLQPCLALVLTNSKIYNFTITIFQLNIYIYNFTITKLSIIILIVGTVIEIFFIKHYNVFYINGFTNGE